MRITPNIDDALLIETKALAERKGITLTQLLEEGLHMRLQSEQLPRAKSKQILFASAQAARPSISELFGIAPDYGTKTT